MAFPPPASSTALCPALHHGGPGGSPEGPAPSSKRAEGEWEGRRVGGKPPPSTPSRKRKDKREFSDLEPAATLTSPTEDELNEAVRGDGSQVSGDPPPLPPPRQRRVCTSLV